jgi:hypothetical protein
MVQDSTSQVPFADPLPVRPREISITRVIGGRLRALYDDTPQPCPIEDLPFWNFTIEILFRSRLDTGSAFYVLRS